jgi:hypothetical protein
MRKTLILALITGVLFLAVPAGADDHLCPMITLKHAKELGLSKKQKVEIEKIRDRLMGEMRALKSKASDDVAAVLTEKQREKAGDLDMGCPMMKGGECPMMKDRKGPHGGECPMRD